MAKKKICFINTSKIWGGGENWQAETMLEFKEKIEIISISNPNAPLFAKMHDLGISTIPFRVGNLSFLNPIKLLKVYFLLKKIAPYAIMFNTATDFKLFTFPAKWAGVTYRLYRRDNGKPLRTHLLNRMLLKKGITHFLPCSHFIKKSALSKNSKLISADKIAVIYNSINLQKWDNLNHNELNTSKKTGNIIFGCIGRLSHEKGQLFLPDTIAQLVRTHTNFKILVAGTGPIKSELESKIQDANIEKYIKLLGFVKSNKKFLNQIDCLLIPSKWEGLPTVAIEAMALNKPVIAFNVAGNPEIVIDGKTGYLIPAYDTKKMADKMCDIIEKPVICEQMGENGRLLVQKQFSREVTDNKLFEYFK